MNERMLAIREMRRRHSASSRMKSKTKPANTEPAKTKLAVFILESLDLDDEQDRRCCEGTVLKQFLDMAAVPNRYVYVRTKRELRAFLKAFAKSKFRYLHFSCHGNATSVGLTLGELGVTDLAMELSKVAAGRRVFLSTCLVTRNALARELFDRCPECLSLVGPAAKIGFSDAIVFWASFYHLMLRQDRNSMKQRLPIRKALEKVSAIFGEKMNAFLQDKDAEHGFEPFPNA